MQKFMNATAMLTIAATARLLEAAEDDISSAASEANRQLQATTETFNTCSIYFDESIQVSPLDKFWDSCLNMYYRCPHQYEIEN